MNRIVLGSLLRDSEGGTRIRDANWAANVIRSFEMISDYVEPILLNEHEQEGTSLSSFSASGFPKDAKTLFETKTAGVLVHDVRSVPQPVFVYANRQAARIFEAEDVDELIGRH